MQNKRLNDQVVPKINTDCIRKNYTIRFEQLQKR